LTFERTFRNHKFRGLNVTTTKRSSTFWKKKCVPPESPALRWYGVPVFWRSITHEQPSWHFRLSRPFFFSFLTYVGPEMRQQTGWNATWSRAGRAAYNKIKNVVQRCGRRKQKPADCMDDDGNIVSAITNADIYLPTLDGVPYKQFTESFQRLWSSAYIDVNFTYYGCWFQYTLFRCFFSYTETAKGPRIFMSRVSVRRILRQPAKPVNKSPSLKLY